MGGETEQGRKQVNMLLSCLDSTLQFFDVATGECSTSQEEKEEWTGKQRKRK